MSKNRGSIEAKSREVIKTIIGSLFFPVYAEEPSGTPAGSEGDKGGSGGDPTQSSDPVVNYEDLIAKARNEEKKKQYGTIEKLKGQVATLTAQHNDDLLKIAGLEEAKKAAEDKLTTASKGDSETVTTLRAELDTEKKARAKAEKELADLKKNTVSREDVEKEIRAELEKEFEVKSYRAEQLAAHPEILVQELVMGDTKEAIDASIKSAITRSNEIRQSLGLAAAGGQQQTTPQGVNNPQGGQQMSFQQVTQQMMAQSQGRTPRSPASPSIDPVQGGGVSLEHLATMDVSSKEYAELRKQLGLK